VVRAWDFATGADRLTAAVFDPSSRGGVRAGVTTDDDGRDDLVVAPGPGGGPRVRQVDAADLAEEESFFAFDPGFLDGIVVG
ncbi:MAG: hypothetical protein K2X82_24025, partial [Gemmataceae bacterium]|nr:hypothetical protein [Gemmataceae bacterium]